MKGKSANKRRSDVASLVSFAFLCFVRPATNDNIFTAHQTERPPNQVRRSSRSKTPRGSLRINQTAPVIIKRRAFEIQSSHLLQPTSFDINKYTVDVWEPDLVNQENSGQCVEYVSDIYQRMFQAEVRRYCVIQMFRSSNNTFLESRLRSQVPTSTRGRRLRLKSAPWSLIGL
jgi:hypothetical protein